MLLYKFSYSKIKETDAKYFMRYKTGTKSLTIIHHAFTNGKISQWIWSNPLPICFKVNLPTAKIMVLKSNFKIEKDQNIKLQKISHKNYVYPSCQNFLQIIVYKNHKTINDQLFWIGLEILWKKIKGDLGSKNVIAGCNWGKVLKILIEDIN